MSKNKKDPIFNFFEDGGVGEESFLFKESFFPHKVKKQKSNIKKLYSFDSKTVFEFTDFAESEEFSRLRAKSNSLTELK